MKLMAFFICVTFGLYSCSSLDPSACSCGQELAKANSLQDQKLMEACAQKGEQLSDKQKVKWFEQIIECTE